ncbi:MAG: galactose-1-epimerase [Martelella sp.]|uniref:aldose epimerase family protein n=1 Tax=unclassified Martelella TaxID=2629616 RepID=UPI000C416B0E|nr:aldose epimerase family protein [Martelella sp.]MAU22307.1 galactose-1-epimerase [Martelella sp.]
MNKENRTPAEQQLTISRGGLTIEVSEYGARLTRCLVPASDGSIADVAPGMDSAEDYAARGGTMGAVLGRYGNIISDAKVEIGGKTYALSANRPPHSMHGGAGNFGTRFWSGDKIDAGTIRLSLESPDGDQGWPGRVRAAVEYGLSENRELTIEMTAHSDRDTYLNMLFHGYWNLRGHGSGSVRCHRLRIAADHYLPKRADGAPDGRMMSVTDTPFDFTQAREIGEGIDRLGRGYAHNLCLDRKAPEALGEVVRLADPSSGRALALSTDQPGVQLFTANLWSGLKGKGGAIYNAHDAVALETQLYPNTPNTPSFKPQLIRAGETYRHRMVIAFHALDPANIDNFLNAPF